MIPEFNLSRKVGKLYFTAPSETGFTILATLNDHPVTLDTNVEVTTPGYYELDITKTNDSDMTEESETIQFIVRDTSRGSSELGLISWTPYPTLDSAPSAFSNAELEFISLTNLPQGFPIPLIARVKDTTTGESLRLNASLAFGSGFSAHRKEQATFLFNTDTQGTFTDCFFVDIPGQALHENKATINLSDCLFQRLPTVGQFNGGAVTLTRSALIEFPYDDNIFKDDDNDTSSDLSFDLELTANPLQQVTLLLHQDGDERYLLWSKNNNLILQSSPDLTNWTNHPEATSPFSIPVNNSETRKFYRLGQ